MAIIRVSPSGPELAYPPTDVGKVLQVDLDGTVSPGATLAPSSVVSTIASLQALPNAVIGQLVRVQSLGRLFITVPAGTSALQSCVVVASLASPTVQFQSIDGTSDKQWSARNAWSIDGLNGNDENTGIDDAHALKTGGELTRRLNGPDVAFDHSLHVRILNSVDCIQLRYLLSSPSLTVSFEFVPTAVLLNDTIATWTPTVGNFPRKITATTVLDWATAGPGGSSLINKRLRVISGTPANVGATCFIAKANPEGLGQQVARLSNPLTMNGTQRTLAPGDGFVVEELATCGIFDVSFAGYVDSSPALGEGPLQVTGMRTTVLKVSGFPGANQGALFFGCELIDQMSSDVISLRSILLLRSSRIEAVNFSGFTSDGCLYCPFGANQFIGFFGAYQNHFGHDLLQGVRASYLCASVGYSGSVHYMDSPAEGLTISSITVLTNATSVAGAGNATFGIRIRPGGRIYYNAASPPTVNGTSGDVSLAIPAGAVTIPYAALPWYDGYQSGQSTLGAGTVNVPVRQLTAGQRIHATPNTPAGIGAPGVLSCPDASRTATQFTINSSVATDASTFDWSVLPRGDAIFIESYL